MNDFHVRFECAIRPTICDSNDLIYMLNSNKSIPIKKIPIQHERIFYVPPYNLSPEEMKFTKCMKHET